MNISLIKPVIALVSVFLMLLAMYSGADETTGGKVDKEAAESIETVSDEFCSDAFSYATGLTPSARNILYEPGSSGLEAFIDSKPGLEPLVFHQFEDNLLPDGEKAGFSITLSCKYKSPELIAELIGQTPDTEISCQAINKRTIDQLYESLNGNDALLPKETWVFDEDDIVYIGPSWIRPWPYQVAYSKSDKLHVRSKTLYASNAWWIPMPKSFKGTHYCHLLSPEYAEKLITREVAAPSLIDE